MWIDLSGKQIELTLLCVNPCTDHPEMMIMSVRLMCPSNELEMTMSPISSMFKVIMK